MTFLAGNALGALLLPHLKETKMAAAELRRASSARKNSVLEALGKSLIEFAPKILEANALDLAELPEDALSSFRDRLALNEKRLADMAESLSQVAKLPDPVGEVVEEKFIQKNLKTRKVRSPLGVIFMIFESRPNVAVEAFSLAFKSGNAVILRGGKESQRTVGVFYDLIKKALLTEGFSPHVLWGITDSNREIVNHLLTEKKWIDVVVPRGGDRLIEFVTDFSKIPVIKNDRGLCHLYVDESADLGMAFQILKNGKVQRPGVCNALETILLHERISSSFLTNALKNLPEVEFFLEEGMFPQFKSFPNVKLATRENFDREYLDLKMSVRTVHSLDEAIEHIERHGSRHSECIVTENRENAVRFQTEVDCACVYWNASTRFTDGFQLGLGGELGISTQKLHVRGPVGLNELTSLRWVFDGNGQVRS
jgi:glutamate-5-semialdehyde dehydrogenase